MYLDSLVLFAGHFYYPDYFDSRVSRKTDAHGCHSTLRRFCMKFVYQCALILFCASVLNAQELVSTKPYRRVVVLEEFTGIHCGYCPDGHARANALRAKYNGEPVLINIHSGGYAVPGTGEPDYRTVFGDSLDRQSNLTGYPAGTVNRHVYAALGSTTALSRNQWDLAATQIMAETSPVNVGLHSQFDATSRKLTVDVEAYYTSDAPTSPNYLNVVLVENNVIGPQSDYSNGNHTNYHHMHMLRWMLTGQWGEEITTTTKGTLVKRTYTYVVPQQFDISQCDVAAYMSQSRQEIYTGAQVVAEGGTTRQVASLALSAQQAVTVASAAKTSFPMSITNLLGQDEKFTLEMNSSMPADWSVQVMINGTAYDSKEFSIAKDAVQQISVDITPGASSGVARVEVSVHSSTFPMSPVIKRQVYLMSGVKNLLMSHPDAVKYDSAYTRAMKNAGLAQSGAMDRNVFEIFSSANAIEGISNVFYNVSWAFPGVTPETMSTLTSLMDKGTNVFVAGQDFGWDLASNDTNANRTDETLKWYNNYIHADFVTDGGTGNNRLTAVSNEPLFKSVAASAIITPYGDGFLYPDEFKPRDGAVAIFKYNSSVRIGGLRYEGKYKLVYLGVGLEQLTPTTGDQIVTQTKKWFSNEISSVEFDDLIASGCSIQPNPASDEVSIHLSEALTNGRLTVYDMQGRSVYEQSVAPGTETFSFPVHMLASGAYRVALVDLSSNKAHSSLLTIVH